MKIIVSHANDLPTELLKSIYVFRAKIFHHILKWSVPLVDGQEIDRFDALNPVWVIAVQDGVVQGCLRILPTTGEYLLKEPVFSDLSDVPLPVDESTVEISRFAVDLEIQDKRYAMMLTTEILRGMLDYLMLNNIPRGVCVTSVSVERLLRSLDVRMGRMGKARRIENCLVVADEIDFTIGFGPIRLQKAA